MKIILKLLLVSLIISSCQSNQPKKVEEETVDKPSKVELVTSNGKYELKVNGKAFYINGAGLEVGNIESLASHGGNSFRTWRTENGKHPGRGG